MPAKHDRSVLQSASPLLADEGTAQGGRGTDPHSGRRAGGEDQDQDREEVRKHAEEEGRHRDAGRLQPELTRLDRAEEERAERGPGRIPGGEDHQRDGDPAAAGGHVLAPAGVGRERDRGAANSGEGAAEDDVDVAQAADVEAHRVGGRRIFAHRAQV